MDAKELHNEENEVESDTRRRTARSMHTKKPSFPIVRMYSTMDRTVLEKEIKRQVLEYRYKIGKSTIYDDQDRTEGDVYDAEIMQSAMNTLAVKERETAIESKKAPKKKERWSLFAGR